MTKSEGTNWIWSHYWRKSLMENFIISVATPPLLLNILKILWNLTSYSPCWSNFEHEAHQIDSTLRKNMAKTYGLMWWLQLTLAQYVNLTYPRYSKVVLDIFWKSYVCPIYVTAQKIKFSFKDFFSKCDQIHSFLRIWLHLLKKSLMENFLFCALRPVSKWREIKKL